MGREKFQMQLVLLPSYSDRPQIKAPKHHLIMSYHIELTNWLPLIISIENLQVVLAHVVMLPPVFQSLFRLKSSNNEPLVF
jgi:hypothetical protein